MASGVKLDDAVYNYDSKRPSLNEENREKMEIFVSEYEESYQWTIFEYDNEIRAREKIELLLKSPELRNYNEFQKFKKDIDAIDLKFKNLFISDGGRKNKKYWWSYGILKYAGKDYANDIFQEYDIQIKII